MKVDMHIHSNYSDRLHAIQHIMQIAKENDFDYISITDHDTINGSKEAIRLSNQYRVKVIPGIEISVNSDCEIHILGYDFDIDSKEILFYQDYMKKERFKESVILLRKVREILGDKDIELILQNNNFKYEQMANSLIKKGYVKNEEEAQLVYLGRGGLLYVKKTELSVDEAINLITSAGGKAVLAHPKRTNLTLDKLEYFIKNLVKNNLWGIEVFHPCHNEKDINDYLYLCKKYNLNITGGSDYHAKKRKQFNEHSGRVVSNIYEGKQWEIEYLNDFK